MYKVLIADDEPLVSIGLKSMLSHNNPVFNNLDVIGTATNGQEALNLLRDKKPDIVISDIKMPLMNGLELLEESRKEFGQIPAFIMLTAYEEFELAKKAITLQAVDYLVKIELNEEDLTNAIKRACTIVDEHRSDNNAVSGTDVHEDFRQKFLLRLFNNALDPDEIEQEAMHLDLNLNYNRFTVATCHTLFSNEPANSENRLQLAASCMDMAREIISRYMDCYFASVNDSQFSMLFGFSEDIPVAEMTSKLMNALQSAHEMVLNYFNADLLFGIGSFVPSATDISSSYEESITAVEAANPGLPVRLFSHIVGANRRSGKDKLIASIQQYVDENMNGRLQLTEVAEAFGLSPAYLSVLFKKNLDTGFSEYISAKKIEKAKHLLLTTDMKIYEVADALGFESAFYFSKVFKKVEGVSPREYLQNKER